MATPWTAVGDRIRCDLHGLTFARTSTCGECEVAAIDYDLIDDKVPLPEPPVGCLDSYQAEAQYQALGHFLAKAGHEIYDEDRQLALRYFAEAAKTYGRADQDRRTREAEFTTERRQRIQVALKTKARA